MKKGFTLVELLVTIAIIAVLTAILLPNFLGARERAKDAQRIEDLGSIKTALRMYYNDFQSYPPGTGITDIGATAPGFIKYAVDLANSGVGYTYNQLSSGDRFVLCTELEAGSGDDDVGSQVRCGFGPGGSNPAGICGLGVGVTRDKLYVVCAN